MSPITKPGQICKHIWLADTRQFNRDQQTSMFIYWDGNRCLLMDVGTSNDIDRLFKNLNHIGIPKQKIAGIVVTHYHFDHAGGVPGLWQALSKQNPDFKIFVPKDTCQKLQNAKAHMAGAKSTYGKKVGDTPKLPRTAYEIIEKDVPLPLELARGHSIELVASPGHTPDHCAPTVFKNGVPVFSFSGESCGALCHAAGLVSMPTSMPPGFCFDAYMQSCQKIAALEPEILGFCHFGAIIGKNEIAQYLFRHQNKMKAFRDIVIRAYGEQPDTRYVVGQVVDFFKQRGPVSRHDSEPNSLNVIFAITFGMMVDLGYRKPKYEKP